MLARVAAVVGTTAVVLSIATAPASAATASVSGYAPGSARVGATIDIQGTGLDTVNDVVFPDGGSGAHALPVSATSSDVQVVVPQTARSGTVSVSDGSVTTTAPMSFTVLPTATMSSTVGSVIYPATAVLTATLSSGPAHLP